MADVSKIKLPNQEVVNIKDARITGIDSTPTEGSTNVVNSGGLLSFLNNGYVKYNKYSGSDPFTTREPSFNALFISQAVLEDRIKSNTGDQGVIVLPTWHGNADSNYYTAEIGFVNNSNRPYTRINHSGTKTEWTPLAFQSDLSDYLPLTGGTLSGWLKFKSPYGIDFYDGDGTIHSIRPFQPFNYDFAHYDGTGWRRIWDSGNDGARSGLDADLLDGQHGSYYATTSQLSGYLSLSGGTMTNTDLVTNLNADLLDGKQGTSYKDKAVYTFTQPRNTGYYKISINSKGARMYMIRARLYRSYNPTEICVSGYNYPSTKTWYKPYAWAYNIVGVSSLAVIFGHDGDNEIWFAIPSAGFFL